MSQSASILEPYRNSDLFSSYYLNERIDRLDAWDCDEEAEEAFEQLRDLWELEKDLVDSYNEDELLDSWIDDVLDILGFGTLSETTLPDGSGYNDRLLFESHEARRDAALRKRDGDSEAMYNLASAILEAKQWNADFEKRFSEERSYRDASQQTKYYLEHTPERLNWGILTDGRRWRLYGTKDYATETYYEVDLPELLESGDLERFKYFYTFFRPAAFREVAGTSYLDTVWSESETAAQELGEDLQDNVFTALRVLGEGFIETNNLDLDPDDEAARTELKEQSLVLLYRLMFVLYAEAEGLIHPDDPKAEKDYQEDFSLEQLRLEIHDDIQSGESFEDYNEYSTSMWNRLQDLFRLIDRGEESLGIPPYNGGLFDRERHSFLTENQVANRYLAEVVYRLATTKNEDGSFVLADYADLDTRHLGTIYEGLLEHQFRIAPEQYAAVAEDGGQVWKPATEVSVAEAVETVDAGELYVVNDEGERKATGAYYTPDYVVTYIVEETIGPLIEDIDADLKEKGLEPSDREYFAQFWQRVLDLKILDPAMGSGHFLTRATGYLTERVMEVVREQEIQSYDEQDLRRGIAKECIYGVDVNGMAVELAKLSMWLETLAADQPLAFLDHHLKTGNSLVGSDITEVLSNGEEETETGQITLFQAFEQTRQRALDHVMDLMGELLAIDNETLADVKSMEDIYTEIRADPLYQRLFSMANVHTAERFGLDVPDDADERMAEAIEDSDDWTKIEEQDWFRTAQTTSDEERFFHWDLEFPEVFFNSDDERMESAGFDVVVGNPPYLLLQGTSQQAHLKRFYPEIFTGSNDLAHFFMYKAIEILKEGGELGYIVTRYWLESHKSDKLRRFLSEQAPPRQIVDFGNLQVWPKINVLTVIPIFRKTSNQSPDIDVLTPSNYSSTEDFLERIRVDDAKSAITADSEYIDGNPWNFRALEAKVVWDRIEQLSTNLGDIADISQGIKTGNDDAFIVTEEEASKKNIDEDVLVCLARSQDIRRYRVSSDRYLIYADENFNAETFPNAFSHLENHKERLSKRAETKDGKYPWWRLQRPRDRNIVLAEQKLLVPHFARENRFSYNHQQITGKTDTFLIVPSNEAHSVEYLSAILNSTLLNSYMSVFGKQKRAGYISYAANRLQTLPIFDVHSPNPDDKYYFEIKQCLSRFLEVIPESEMTEEQYAQFQNLLTSNRGMSPKPLEEILSCLAKSISKNKEKFARLNLSLPDYLGNYADGSTLSNLGYQPPTGLSNSLLTQTESDNSDFEKLRITKARIERDGSDVTVFAVPYVKPVAEEEYETNSRGYATLGPIPAMHFSDLNELQANLIEVFVPYAVDEAGSFAGYRDNATATISPLDRLEDLTLPALSDVEDGLERYIDTRERAEKLDEKIERTDELIDEIVYELYGLSDEEIETVEEAVGD